MDLSDLCFLLAMLSMLAGVVTLVAVLCGALLAVSAGLLTSGVFLAYVGWTLHKGGTS